MADDKAATGPKTILDKIAELTKALAGVATGGTEKADADKPKTVDAAVSLDATVARVRASYDSSATWTVGAFVALGCSSSA